MTVSSDLSTLAVIGTGVMGRGIAQWAAQAGLTVLLHDARPGAVEEAIGFIRGLVERGVEKGRQSRDAADATLARLKPAAGLADLAGAGLVIEAIVEKIEPKQALFAELEGIVGADCVLATNTSSLSVTAIAAGCKTPERVAGLHFFNPVPLMKVVEVIAGERTAPAVIDRLLALVDGTGHRAVACQDTPGFLVNHAGRGLLTEGLAILREGVAQPAEIDRVMREAAGFPMGPCELLDLTGLDVSQPVLELIYGGFYQEPRYRPSPLLARRLTAGLLGRKVGEGFYRYDGGKKQEPGEIAPPPLPATSAPVWLGALNDALRAILAARLTAGGLVCTDGPAPGPTDTVVLAPLGQDATAAALAGGFAAERVVAIDAFLEAAFAEGGRITLMTPPVGDPARCDAVAAALLAAGHKVTRIQDSVGFIAQRVLATIVNIGCDIAQQRIAAPADVDAAVRLGLGYPAGPLSLGDRLGAKAVLAILEAMLALTGDPRYRPSPWLRRRAGLGISLTAAAL